MLLYKIIIPLSPKTLEMGKETKQDWKGEWTTHANLASETSFNGGSRWKENWSSSDEEKEKSEEQKCKVAIYNKYGVWLWYKKKYNIKFEKKQEKKTVNNSLVLSNTLFLQSTTNSEHDVFSACQHKNSSI